MILITNMNLINEKSNYRSTKRAIAKEIFKSNNNKKGLKNKRKI